VAFLFLEIDLQYCLCIVFSNFFSFFFLDIQLSSSQLKDRYRNIEKTHGGDGNYQDYRKAGKNTYKPNWFAKYYDAKY